MKGLLNDDQVRMGYADGSEDGPVSANDRYNAYIDREIKNLQEGGDDYYNSGTGFMSKAKQSLGGSGQGEKLLNDLKQVRREMYDDVSDEELLNRANTKIKDAGLEYQISSKFINKDKKYDGGLMQYAEGGSLLADDMVMEEDMPTHTMPDGTVMPGATHEEDEMMDEAPEENMVPDEEMETDYLDFILDEALSEEEENMLMSRLEQDEELAMLFDKVIDVAQEFAGSGPVEGPGSGVSDSIPARLSDGEFVFTAKAVEEIGADNLMAMMKEAEMKAEERQGLAEGGQPEEEETVVVGGDVKPSQKNINVTKTTVGSQASQQEEQDLVGDEIKKGMLSNRNYVRS